jgi:DNA transformation protein and related proteins
MEDIPLHESLVAQLATLGDITSRAMFGGIGLYWRGVIFAIAHRGRLYLKVDDQSKPDFEKRGMGPFRPNERQTLKAYYEVPPDVIMGDEILLLWVKEAIGAAQV